MCGIAAVSLTPADAERVDPNKLMTALLLDIQSRGKDSTGVAYFDPQGEHWIQKGPVNADLFTPELDIPEGTSNIIAHTRFGTKGSEYDNDNNHPIPVGRIVGVHNGGVWNDDQLFHEMGCPRVADVDSEAIFAALYYGPMVREDTGKVMLNETTARNLEEIDGTAAIFWHHIDTPDTLHIARLWDSPLIWTQTQDGSFLAASTHSALKAAAKECSLTIETPKSLPEGNYCIIRNGMVTESIEFEPLGRAYRRAGWGSGWGGTTTVLGNPPKKDKKEDDKDDDVGDDDKDDFEREWWDVPNVSHLQHQAIQYWMVHRFESSISMKEEDYQDEYYARELAIIEWAKEYSPTPEKLTDHGGLLRPGDLVRTTFGGRSVVGQIVLLPATFPHGLYIVRVQVPYGEYSEDVFIGRLDGEIQVHQAEATVVGADEEQ